MLKHLNPAQRSLHRMAQRVFPFIISFYALLAFVRLLNGLNAYLNFNTHIIYGRFYGDANIHHFSTKTQIFMEKH